MTPRKNRRTLPLLLALGLAATVALPAATAVQLASQGSAAADMAASYAGGLGADGATCMSTDCTALGAGSAGAGGAKASTKAAWNLQADLDEQHYIDLATGAAMRAKADAEAKADGALEAAMELKDSIHVDTKADADLKTDYEHAWDSEADLGAGIAIDGVVRIGGGQRVDLEAEEQVKEDLEAHAEAQVEATTSLIDELLAQIQAQLDAASKTAVQAAGQVQAAVGGALGIAQSAHVEADADLDLAARLGAVTVPEVTVPRADLAGAGSVVASAEAAASGVVRG